MLQLDFFFFSKASHLTTPDPLRKTEVLCQWCWDARVPGKINTLMLLGFCSIISETLEHLETWSSK